MKKLDSQSRLAIPSDLLELVGITPPCDLLLIRKGNEKNCFYLTTVDSPFKFNKQVLCKLHADEKGRICFKNCLKNVIFEKSSKNFIVCAVLAEDGNNWLEIELVP